MTERKTRAPSLSNFSKISEYRHSPLPPILDSRIPLAMVGTSHGDIETLAWQLQNAPTQTLDMTTPEVPPLHPPRLDLLMENLEKKFGTSDSIAPNYLPPFNWSFPWRSLTLRRPRCAPEDFVSFILCSNSITLWSSEEFPYFLLNDWLRII